jgi:hypothetical protein
MLGSSEIHWSPGHARVGLHSLMIVSVKYLPDLGWTSPELLG